jgi:hypothetical protein
MSVDVEDYDDISYKYKFENSLREVDKDLKLFEEK